MRSALIYTPTYFSFLLLLLLALRTTQRFGRFAHGCSLPFLRALDVVNVNILCTVLSFFVSPCFLVTVVIIIIILRLVAKVLHCIYTYVDAKEGYS